MDKYADVPLTRDALAALSQPALVDLIDKLLIVIDDAERRRKENHEHALHVLLEHQRENKDKLDRSRNLRIERDIAFIAERKRRAEELARHARREKAAEVIQRHVRLRWQIGAVPTDDAECDGEKREALCSVQPTYDERQPAFVTPTAWHGSCVLHRTREEELREEYEAAARELERLAAL